jgi:hypothetical protein
MQHDDPVVNNEALDNEALDNEALDNEAFNNEAFNNESFDQGGHLYERRLLTGKSVFVDPLTFGRARIHIGLTNSLFYDDGW